MKINHCYEFLRLNREVEVTFFSKSKLEVESKQHYIP